MSLEYKPSGLIPESKTKALLDPISQQVQGLPNTIIALQQFKQQKAQHELQMLLLQAQLAEAKQKVGTGAPPPVAGDMTATGNLSAPGTATPMPGGPEEQMLGSQIQPPQQSAVETPEQQQARLGTTAYGQLHPPASMMINPIINKEGQVIGQTQGGKPTVADLPADFAPIGQTSKGFPVNFDKQHGAYLVNQGGKNIPFDSSIHGNLPTGMNSPTQQFKNSTDLRKEFTKESDPITSNLQADAKGLSEASKNNALGDASLAFALTRGAMGSSGRITQNEINQFGPKLGGFSDKIQQAIRGAVDGGSFDPKIRAQILDMVKQSAVQDNQDLINLENQYRDIAGKNNLHPDQVIVDRRPRTLLPYLNPENPPPGGTSAAAQALIDKYKAK